MMDHTPIEKRIQTYLSRHCPYRQHDGVFVWNPQMMPYVQHSMDVGWLKSLRDDLSDALTIRLGANDLPLAADFQEGSSTNYHAVWVRDAAWIAMSLADEEPEKAKAIVEALNRYYATPQQIERFSNSSPHIRFEAATLDDVMVDGKPEYWNHKQNDAHALFLLACFRVGVRPAIDRFATFFKRIDVASAADAGAWEEIDRVNTSSIAAAAMALAVWDEADLAQVCLSRVRQQLEQGGESPDYPRDDIRYREADAALLNLFLPAPVLSERELRQAMVLLDRLIRPSGVLRYENDSYQSGNYWIAPRPTDGPSATGDASGLEAFRRRRDSLIPGTEAEWFFDSKLAMCRLTLARMTQDSNQRAEDERRAEWHLKRAIGQLTGHWDGVPLLTARGDEVPANLFPESLNSVLVNGGRHYLPSPITPLNWAKASLRMALTRFEEYISE